MLESIFVMFYIILAAVIIGWIIYQLGVLKGNSEVNTEWVESLQGEIYKLQAKQDQLRRQQEQKEE